MPHQVLRSQSEYLGPSGSRFATAIDCRLAITLGLAPEAITGNRFAIKTRALRHRNLTPG